MSSSHPPSSLFPLLNSVKTRRLVCFLALHKHYSVEDQPDFYSGVRRLSINAFSNSVADVPPHADADTFVGTIAGSVMLSLGEMIAALPLAGGHITLAQRFVGPAMSFTLGPLPSPLPSHEL